MGNCERGLPGYLRRRRADNAILDLLSPFHSKIGGLLAILYILHRICSHYKIEAGKASVYCDNKGALSSVFSDASPNISSYLSPDYNLIELCKQMLKILPITVVHAWVKGHYTGKQRELKHDFNEQADRLAVQHRKKQPRNVTTKSSPS